MRTWLTALWTCTVAFSAVLSGCGSVGEDNWEQPVGALRQRLRLPPVIKSVSSPYCSTAGACEVVIGGDNFESTTDVYLNNVRIPSSFEATNRTIRFVAPASTVDGIVTLEVDNLGDVSSYAPGFYYFVDEADFLPAHGVRASLAVQKVVSGDFNSDGTQDLAMLLTGANYIEVALGIPLSRKFARPVAINLPAGASGAALAVGRIDWNSTDDLVVSLPNRGSVAVLLGKTGAPFGMTTSEQSLTTGSNICQYPRAVLLADINGDALLDVVAGCDYYPSGGGPAFASYRGLGSGAFTYYDLDSLPMQAIEFAAAAPSGVKLATLYVRDAARNLYYANHTSSGFSAVSTIGVGGTRIIGDGMVVTDLGGDGYPDLAVLQSARSQVQVHQGAPGPSFAAPTTLFTRAAYKTLFAQEMDGKRGVELVAAGGTSGIDVFPNSGTGTFSTTSRADIELAAAAPTASGGDLDGDGRGELLIPGAELSYVDTPSSTVYIRYGTSSSSPPPLRLKTGGSTAHVMAMADFDLDGSSDDVAVISPGTLSKIQIFRRDAIDQLTPVATLSAPAFLDSIATAQLDGDGYVDIVVASSRANRLYIYYSDGAPAAWRSPTSIDLMAGVPSAVRVAQLNPDKDSYPDLVVSLYGTNQIAFALGQMGGSFAAFAKTGPLDLMGGAPLSVEVGCITDCMMRPNLIVLNQNPAALTGQIEILRWGAMGYELAVKYATPGAASSMLVADLNSDARVDVVVTNEGHASISMFPQLTTGGLGARVDSPSCIGPTGVVAAKLNSDPYSDLVVSCDSNPGSMRSAQVQYGTPFGSFGQAGRYLPKRLTSVGATPVFSSGPMLSGTLDRQTFLIMGAEREAELSLLLNASR